MEEYLP